MKGKNKVLLARAMRVAAVLSLLTFLAFIARYLIVHKSVPRRVEPQSALKIPAQKVEKEEGIRHFEYKEAERRAEIKADKHYEAPDGRNHLEGHVEVRDFGRGEDQDAWIYGDTVIYDKQMTGYELIGHARVKYKDVTVESEALSYDKNAEILKTSKGAAFVSEKMKGISEKLIYSLGPDVLQLEGSVRVELPALHNESVPLVFRGKTFAYSRKEKKGSMAEGAVFSSGKSRGSALAMDFVMSGDEKYVRMLFLKGGPAKAHLVDEAKKAPPVEAGGSYFQGEEHDLEADEIDIQAFLNMPKIHSLDGRGSCSLKILSSSGGAKTIRSETMRIVYDRWGGLREFRAAGGAVMDEKRPAGGGERRISADEVFIDGQKNTLTADKRKETPCRLESADLDVQAERIMLHLTSEDFSAWRGITAVLKAAAGKTSESVFFSRGKPVFVTAQTLRYSRAEKRFVFNEDKSYAAENDDVKIWQDKAMLAAKDLALFEESREIAASGGVRSFFPHLPKKPGSRETRVEIGGTRMLYEPGKNRISYEGGCSMKADTVGMAADSLRVGLRENRGELMDVSAKGGVVISQGLREGKGAEGSYVLDEEKFVLTGGASLTDPLKGKAEGDKLTFYLGDDRILIENKNQKRSLTVIK